MITGIAVAMLLVFALMLLAGELYASPEAELKQAIHRGRIQPWYSPVMCSRDGQVVGAEIQPRWAHSREGILLPAHFMPEVMRSGLEVRLSRRLMQQAGRDLAAGGLPDGFHLAVRVTPAVLCDPDFVADCDRLRAALGPEGTVVVILGGVDTLVSQTVMTRLQTLRGAGVKIALDNFGCGEGCLAHLASLPLDYLRPGRALMAALLAAESDEAAGRMMEMLTVLSRQLSLQMVVEEVSSARDRDRLIQCGVPWLQGDWFSPPLPAGAFFCWLRNWRAPAGGEREDENESEDGNENVQAGV